MKAQLVEGRIKEVDLFHSRVVDETGRKWEIVEWDREVCFAVQSEEIAGQFILDGTQSASGYLDQMDEDETWGETEDYRYIVRDGQWCLDYYELDDVIDSASGC
ncbi:hypothetical protein ACFL2Q_19825 [Thermodesulfobacteriota bacterium]